ncbi:winged helix-turn-helix domain-containing protein [Defluviimonas sp. WL0024]|uniref:Winged helix-turn-helix domain-containing protein n=1 Tax=Albidovulum salinarum TaxID=2984153 RepID=A0ABT2X9I7_9RHOB|nr:winged helix-turn-helix domain-containing protein [Defluviimonas sp. WL0024]MCU9850604.1 winged helix-turn-helix domain-containing protein [Defluviimonas sp. WL0024]
MVRSIRRLVRIRLTAPLASNPDRLVTKDELVERVWDARFISDSAISTAVKEARKAVGDDGARQSIIRTVHGRGIRCVAEVRVRRDSPGEHELPTDDPGGFQGRPSIAVLPFASLGAETGYAPLADALLAEIISAISRLRWIAVIARGSSFRFRAQIPDPSAVRSALGVRYVLAGLIEVAAKTLFVNVELSETASDRVIWSERFSAPIDGIHEIRSRIVAEIVTALEIRIPMAEASAAEIRPSSNLDAWAEFHLGLRHLYRFNRIDNSAAETRFRKAIEKEPGLARAHAGLSFTAFQSAFMHYGRDTDAMNLARSAADKSLELDFLDPFANYCMGRVQWLNGDLEQAIAWMSRSPDVSPNFAQGSYAKALMMMNGEGAAARALNSNAMVLSPLDPLHYAMLANQGNTHPCEGNFAEGARWIDRAAKAPGTHYLIAMLAGAAHHLAGNDENARMWTDRVRQRRPDITTEEYFRSFPYAEGQHNGRMWKAFRDLGF